MAGKPTKPPKERIITADDLSHPAIDACEEQIELFRQLFPDGAQITRGNYQIARVMDLVWWIEETDIHLDIVDQFIEKAKELWERYQERIALLKNWADAELITADEYADERARVEDILRKHHAWEIAERVNLPNDGTEAPEIL
jgi:hypothetical protein